MRNACGRGVGQTDDLPDRAELAVVVEAVEGGNHFGRGLEALGGVRLDALRVTSLSSTSGTCGTIDRTGGGVWPIRFCSSKTALGA